MAKIGSGYGKSAQPVTSRGVNFRLGGAALPGLRISNDGPATAYIMVNARTIGAQGCDPASRAILDISMTTNNFFTESYEMVDFDSTGMVGYDEAPGAPTTTMDGFYDPLIANGIIEGDTLRMISGTGGSPVSVSDYYEFPIRSILSKKKLQLDVALDITTVIDSSHRVFEIWRAKDTTKTDNNVYWYSAADVITNGLVLKPKESIDLSCFPGNPRIYSFTAVTVANTGSASLSCAQTVF